MSSKLKTQSLDINLLNGWRLIGALTRTADTTATLVGDWTDRIQKGDKIWWQSDGSSRFNYVIGVSYSAPNTTITITPGYLTTANDSRFESGHSLTAPYISHIENPFGFPTVFNWTPTMFGSTSAGTGTYTTQDGNFFIQGKVCHFFLDLVWSAHTGTGAMRFTTPLSVGPIQDWPVIVANIINITLPQEVHTYAYVHPSNYIPLESVRNSNTPTTVTLDAVGGIRIAGAYPIA